MYSGFAAFSDKAPLTSYKYTPIPLHAEEVEIKIECCGVCHSDIHSVDNDWKTSKYPLVPGHEVIGTISRVGEKVVGLRFGQRVGVGPQVGSCGKCQWCTSNEETWCRGFREIYNSRTGNPMQPYTHGGLATFTRAHFKWAVPIPDSLDSETAAPLLCAGVTVWAPFFNNTLPENAVVGVVGMGGLGHLALQFGVKLQHNVWAISRSADKEAEAKHFGAKFLNSSDKSAMKQHRGKFDFLLSTVSSEKAPWNQYLSLLKKNGTMCLVGLPPKMTISPAYLASGRVKLTGSILANRQQIADMMAFAAKHKVRAMVEVLPFSADNVNIAFDKVRNNEARYRMVLTHKQVGTAKL